MTKRLKNLGVRLKEITSNKSFIKNVGKVLVAVAYIMFVVALASEVNFAAGSKEGSAGIFSNIENLLDEAKDGILTISGIAVIIGVGTGAIMKKFSMGKQDKIEMGNKLMKDSIIAFAILNATPRIVNFIIARTGTGNESISLPGTGTSLSDVLNLVMSSYR